jgi:chromosome segregation ATPase
LVGACEAPCGTASPTSRTARTHRTHLHSRWVTTTLATTINRNDDNHDSYVKANDDLLNKMTKLKKDLATREQVNGALAEQNAEFQKALAARGGETSVIEKDSTNMSNLKVHADKKTGKFETRRSEAEDERAELQGKIRELQEAIEAETKNTESVVRSHSTYERQREIMNKNLRDEGDATQATLDLVVVTENEIKNLENELRAFRTDALERRVAIEAMAEDRDKYEGEATAQNQNYYAVIEDVKLADMEIVDVQRQIIEVDTKLKTQQNMCVILSVSVLVSVLVSVPVSVLVPVPVPCRAVLRCAHALARKDQIWGLS